MDQVPSNLLEKIEKEGEEKFENVNWEEIGDEDDEEIEEVKIWHKNRIFVPKPVEESVMILCDDFPSVRRMAIRTLEKLNFKEVKEMEDGTEIVDFFSNNPENDVDMIITDEEMLDMNGSLAVRELRRNGVEIPIVTHSGNTLEHQQALFYLRKTDGFVSKPADKKKIMDATRRFIEYNEEKKEEDEEGDPFSSHIDQSMSFGTNSPKSIEEEKFESNKIGYSDYSYDEEDEKKEEDDDYYSYDDEKKENYYYSYDEKKEE